MELTTEIINGKRKLVITRVASGIDRSKELVRAVMPECTITFKDEVEKINGDRDGRV